MASKTGVVPKPLPQQRRRKIKPPVKVWQGTRYRIIAKGNVNRPYAMMGRTDTTIETALILEHIHVNSMGESVWVVCTDMEEMFHLKYLMADLAAESGKVPDNWVEEPPKQRVAMKVDGHPYR